MLDPEGKPCGRFPTIKCVTAKNQYVNPLLSLYMFKDLGKFPESMRG